MVYLPRTREAGAYSCTNTAQPACQVLSVEALAGQVGIDPFPGVPDATKAVAARLPLPHPPRQRSTTP